MLGGFTSYLSQKSRKRQIFNELNSYSDRELDDMGVVRADIARIAEQATRR